MTFDTSDLSDIFQCKKCGDCCKGYGGTYVAPTEIEAIAGHLKTDSEFFVEKYCQMSGTKPVLAQGENGYCIFWDQFCTIHPVKPRMCREWPFIKAVLVDIGNWEIMAGSCPGIRTDVPDDVIRACVEKIVLNRE
ncbi:MAG: YkgJ family cysteine cluster protein [Deltaproteobacteria bacterium]|nr:YkgJ family cysteine cluster protein [Deltaproteobacteria bacterium]